MAVALVVEVLEQLVARQVAAILDDAREAAVAMPPFVPDAALAAKAEADVAAVDLGVPVAQGRQAEAVVGLRVFAVADAEQGQLEQPDDRRQHPLARQAVPAQIGVDARPDPRQRPANASMRSYFVSSRVSRQRG